MLIKRLFWPCRSCLLKLFFLVSDYCFSLAIFADSVAKSLILLVKQCLKLLIFLVECIELIYALSWRWRRSNACCKSLIYIYYILSFIMLIWNLNRNIKLSLFLRLRYNALESISPIYPRSASELPIKRKLRSIFSAIFIPDFIKELILSNYRLCKWLLLNLLTLFFF